MRSGRCRSSLRLMVWSAHIHCVWVSLTLRSWPSCTISRSLGLLAEGGKLPAIASMNPLCQSLVTRMRKLCSCLEEAVALFPGGKSQGCDSLLVLIFFFLVRPETHLSPTVASCPCFRLPVLKTVYCMNEAEMVDVALGILIEVKSAVSFLTLITRNSLQAESRLGPWLMSISGGLRERSHLSTHFRLPLSSASLRSCSPWPLPLRGVHPPKHLGPDPRGGYGCERESSLCIWGDSVLVCMWRGQETFNCFERVSVGRDDILALHFWQNATQVSWLPEENNYCTTLELSILYRGPGTLVYCTVSFNPCSNLVM